jgi:hypothetical protein
VPPVIGERISDDKLRESPISFLRPRGKIEFGKSFRIVAGKAHDDLPGGSSLDG